MLRFFHPYVFSLHVSRYICMSFYTLAGLYLQTERQKAVHRNNRTNWSNDLSLHQGPTLSFTHASKRKINLSIVIPLHSHQQHSQFIIKHRLYIRITVCRTQVYIIPNSYLGLIL